MVGALGGLRVTEAEAFLGLDLSQHSETAYVFESRYGGVSHPAVSEPLAPREAASLQPSHG